MAIDIVNLASYKMVIFHSYVNVYQRVQGSWKSMKHGQGMLEKSPEGWIEA